MTTHQIEKLVTSLRQMALEEIEQGRPGHASVILAIADIIEYEEAKSREK